VLLEPERFEWVSEGEGVFARRLGTFNGRGLELLQWKLDAGSHWIAGAAATRRLLFCLGGEGTIDERPVRPWTTIELMPGDSPRLSADSSCEFFVFVLPRLDPVLPV
jgi:hypothetical protein